MTTDTPFPAPAAETAPRRLLGARLPAWLLPAQWPAASSGQPAWADLTLDRDRIAAIAPHAVSSTGAAPQAGDERLDGALVLPCFVDAHTHLDKAYTVSRLGQAEPGLLGAIEAMVADRAHWTAADVRTRATRGLARAWAHGTRHLRTHVDWTEADGIPLAWPVLRELAQEWRGRLVLEQVSLMKLPMFEDPARADWLARQVAATGEGAVLGAFVHSTNWNENALRHLLQAAQRHDLDVDLHVDEELQPRAQGLAATARIMRELGFEGRVVCGHICALAVQDHDSALRLLDEIGRLPITLIALPTTNLLLQDATTGRTPRTRGITLIKEARARGIPVLLASDNVQDPFCRIGNFDPAELMGTATLAAQLERPFDDWSDSLCRSDWLARPGAASAPAARPTLIGQPADLVVFDEADAWSWPAHATPRRVCLLYTSPSPRD